MKKIAYFIALLFITFLAGAQTLPTQSSPARLVNDFAGLMTAEETRALESKLVAFDDSTTNQIAVITVKSLEGFDISDYTIKTFQKWKIGAAKKNNGILILISGAEHKAWITVGNGLEPVVTDALSRRVIDNIMIPAFKQNQYYAGLNAGTSQLMSYATGEFHDKRPKEAKGRGNSNWIFLIILVVFIIISITKGGGGPGQHISGGGSNWPFWMLLGGMMGGGGRNEGWGGGNSGGRDDGGGFGGFGGGDTGGGGAGGSW